MNPNIALIHAIHAAISPVEKTFASDWPDASIVSLLAEDLTHALSSAGKQTDAIRNRIKQLTDFATNANVDGILFTCSAFADSIENARNGSTIPILKPNEAMFEEAIEIGGRVGMLVTFESAIPSMISEFTQMSRDAGKDVIVEAHYVPGALDALKAGDPDQHDALLAEAAHGFPPCDTLMLAQFSMSGAKSSVEIETTAKVLTSPSSAIAKLKSLINS